MLCFFVCSPLLFCKIACIYDRGLFFLCVCHTFALLLPPVSLLLFTFRPRSTCLLGIGHAMHNCFCSCLRDFLFVVFFFTSNNTLPFLPFVLLVVFGRVVLPGSVSSCTFLLCSFCLLASNG